MNKKISFPIAIIIIVVCAVLVGVIAWQYSIIPGIGLSGFTPTPSEKSCKQLREEIENDFDVANYCEQDSDCKAIQLGGAYVELGCYKFVNVATDKNKFLERGGLLDRRRVEEYDKKCGQVSYKCAIAPQPTCVSGKCVYVEPEDETADWKIYKNEEYGFEFEYPENLGFKYVTGDIWPPQITIEEISSDFFCEKKLTDKPITYERIIDNNKYCIENINVGYGDHTYILTYYDKYKIITYKNNKKMTIKVGFKYGECLFETETEEKICNREVLDFSNSFDVPLLVSKILSTFKFID